MSISYAQPNFTIEFSRNRRLVAGLRDLEKPTECKIFRANLDGSRGKLLRVEKPVDFETAMNNGGKGWQKKRND